MIPSRPLGQGGEDAGLGSAVGGSVLVRRHRGADAGAASAAGDPDRSSTKALASLDAEFDKLYADTGRDSIPPERLLRAALLQAFFSIRSERLLMEQLDYNLLYRWFVGLGVDDAVWDHSAFSKNRDRLLEADVAAKFLDAVLANPQVKPLLSDEHFSVDGTLIEAWASMKSFRAKDGADEPPSAGPQRRARFPQREAHATTRTPRPPTPRPSSTRRAKARKPSCASWGTP